MDEKELTTPNTLTVNNPDNAKLCRVGDSECEACE